LYVTCKTVDWFAPTVPPVGEIEYPDGPETEALKDAAAPVFLSVTADVTGPGDDVVLLAETEGVTWKFGPELVVGDPMIK